jgi:hypothetical protein
MVAVMVIGMVVLGAASDALLDLPDRTAVMIVEMALAMTLPMVAWMRFRGHGWRPGLEMAVVMLLPAVAALVLLETRLIENEMILLTIEHTAMFVGMFIAMLVRRDEYTGHDHGAGDQARTHVDDPISDGF